MDPVPPERTSVRSTPDSISPVSNRRENDAGRVVARVQPLSRWMQHAKPDAVPAPRLAAAAGGGSAAGQHIRLASQHLRHVQSRQNGVDPARVIDVRMRHDEPVETRNALAREVGQYHAACHVTAARVSGARVVEQVVLPRTDNDGESLPDIEHAQVDTALRRTLDPIGYQCQRRQQGDVTAGPALWQHDPPKYQYQANAPDGTDGRRRHSAVRDF